MTDVDTIIAEIAKKQLRIETLDTRNADSLDFHDVSVWGLRTALLCAFEAGRKSARRKPRVIETGKKDTSYRATIEASYQDLVEVWGEPSKGDNYKTEAEWVIRPAGKSVITIYNYKNSRAYNYKYPEIKDVREWHIGGHTSDVVDRLLNMMKERAKLIHRAQ